MFVFLLKFVEFFFYFLQLVGFKLSLGLERSELLGFLFKFGFKAFDL